MRSNDFLSNSSNASPCTPSPLPAGTLVPTLDGAVGVEVIGLPPRGGLPVPLPLLPSKLLQTTSSTRGRMPTSSSAPLPPCTVHVLPLPVGPYANRRQFSPLDKKSCTRGKVVRLKKADWELEDGSTARGRGSAEDGEGAQPNTSVNL